MFLAILSALFIKDIISNTRIEWNDMSCTYLGPRRYYEYRFKGYKMREVAYAKGFRRFEVQNKKLIMNKYNIGDYVYVNIENGREEFSGKVVGISLSHKNIVYTIESQNIERVGEGWIVKKIDKPRNRHCFYKNN